MKLLILFLSFLFAGCSGAPLPRSHQFEVKIPNAALFPVNRYANLAYDTRKTGDATEVEINSILRGGLKNKGKSFLTYSKKYGVSARFAASVAIAESGGNSRVSRRYNNYFGLMRKGHPISFKNSEECLDYFFQLITRYHGKKRYTVSQIQKVYCPSGGEWRKNVMANMNKIK